MNPENRHYKILILPICILILLVGFLFTWDPISATHPSLAALGIKYSFHEIALTTFFLALAWFINRIIDVYFWRWFVEKRIVGKVPRLLRTIASAIVFLAAFFCIIGFVYQKSITGLLATTGAFGIILGLGLRGTIESALNGVTISIDRIFKIGDVVFLKNYLDGPSRVVEITWRYTCFRDISDNLVFIPNNLVSAAAVTNYSRPNSCSAFSLPVSIFIGNQPLERIVRILEAALKATDIVVENPEPKVRVIDLFDGSAKFDLKYWIDIDSTTFTTAKNAVYTSVCNHLTMAGLRLEITSWRYKEDPAMQSPEAFAESILRKIKLFSEISNEEFTSIAKQITKLELKAGTTIIQQGNTDSSMYILAEGLVKVLIKTDKHKELLTVAKLSPGSYFGEMSLLIGEPRSATVVAVTDCVVYEITKDFMQQLFTQHASLMELLSKKIAERHIMNLNKEKALEKKDLDVKTKSYADQFVKMIQKWFGHSET